MACYDVSCWRFRFFFSGNPVVGGSDGTKEADDSPQTNEPFIDDGQLALLEVLEKEERKKVIKTPRQLSSKKARLTPITAPPVAAQANQAGDRKRLSGSRKNSVSQKPSRPGKRAARAKPGIKKTVLAQTVASKASVVIEMDEEEIGVVKDGVFVRNCRPQAGQGDTAQEEENWPGAALYLTQEELTQLTTMDQ